MVTREHSKPVGGVRVHRSDVDEVFLATMTQGSRPAKKSDHLPDRQKSRIKKTAEEIVEKSKSGKRK